MGSLRGHICNEHKIAVRKLDSRLMKHEKEKPKPCFWTHIIDLGTLQCIIMTSGRSVSYRQFQNVSLVENYLK